MQRRQQTSLLRRRRLRRSRSRRSRSQRRADKSSQLSGRVSPPNRSNQIAHWPKQKLWLEACNKQPTNRSTNASYLCQETKLLLLSFGLQFGFKLIFWLAYEWNLRTTASFQVGNACNATNSNISSGRTSRKLALKKCQPNDGDKPDNLFLYRRLILQPSRGDWFALLCC